VRALIVALCNARVADSCASREVAWRISTSLLETQEASKLVTPALSFAEFFKLLFPGFYVVTAAWLYGSLFWGLPIEGAESVAFYAFAGLFFGFMIDAWDPLLRSDIFPEAKFFRSQFPSRYLARLCDKCESPCPSKQKEAQEVGFRFPHSIWFYVFDNLFPDYLRSYVLGASSGCRAVVYTKYVSLLFLLTSVATFAARRQFSVRQAELSLAKLQVTYVVACLIIYSFVTLVHRTRKRPSGVWAKWRGVCQDQIFWLHANMPTVKSLLCQGKAPSSSEGTDVEGVDAHGNLNQELQHISDSDIRELTAEILKKAPLRFWKRPSSSSGKYHPLDERGPGGAVVHTKRCVRVAEHLSRAFSLSSQDRDILIAAMIVHDVAVRDETEGNREYEDHPLRVKLVSNHIWGGGGLLTAGITRRYSRCSAT